MYPIVGASADDNCTVEDQHEPPGRQNNQVDAISFFSNKIEWPQVSAKYFTRELNKSGDGKRGLVFNYLIDKKRISGFRCLACNKYPLWNHSCKIKGGLQN